MAPPANICPDDAPSHMVLFCCTIDDNFGNPAYYLVSLRCRHHQTCYVLTGQLHATARPVTASRVGRSPKTAAQVMLTRRTCLAAPRCPGTRARLLSTSCAQFHPPAAGLSSLTEAAVGRILRRCNVRFASVISGERDPYAGANGGVGVRMELIN